MEFNRKLRARLYLGIIYIVLGTVLIAGTFFIKTDNDFISSFGLIMAVLGIVRIRNYYLITRNEETIRKQEIAETDERNILIMNKAKSAAMNIYILLLGLAVIVLSLFNMQQAAKWISYSVCFLVTIYWICYFVYRKKL